MTPNIKIGIYGKYPLFKMKTKYGEIDRENRTIMSQNGTYSYRKSPLFYIAGIRYLAMLLIAVLFSHFDLIYSGYLVLASLLYLVIFSIYHWFGARIASIALLPLPLTYLYLSQFDSSLIPQNDLQTMFLVIFSNTVALHFFVTLISEIKEKKHNKFYQTYPVLRYIVFENFENEETKKTSLSTYFTAIFFILSILIYSFVQYSNFKAIEIIKKETIKTETKEIKNNNNKIAQRDAAKVEKEMLKLDKKAIKYGFTTLPHRRDSSIIDYEEVLLKKTTPLFQTTSKTHFKYGGKDTKLGVVVKPYLDKKGYYWHFGELKNGGFKFVIEIRIK